MRLRVFQWQIPHNANIIAKNATKCLSLKYRVITKRKIIINYGKILQYYKISQLIKILEIKFYKIL